MHNNNNNNICNYVVTCIYQYQLVCIDVKSWCCINLRLQLQITITRLHLHFTIINYKSANWLHLNRAHLQVESFRTIWIQLTMAQISVERNAKRRRHPKSTLYVKKTFKEFRMAITHISQLPVEIQLMLKKHHILFAVSQILLLL